MSILVHILGNKFLVQTIVLSQL